MAQIFFKKIVINAANKFRPYELHLQQVLISFKTSNFNVGFFKYKSFNKYLLNDLYLKKPTLKLLVLKEISTCCKCNSYGRNLLALLNYNKYLYS